MGAVRPLAGKRPGQGRHTDRNRPAAAGKEGSDMNADQLLLYGGAAGAALSLLVLVFSLVRYRIESKHLNERLDEEYGKKIRN